MRSTIIILIILAASIAFPIQKVSAQQSDFSYQIFYDQLSPYGEWVNYEGYGYAWIPDAGPEFEPYSTEGHWILTEYGWTWMSNYPWGWATFHYGRWDYDNYYGWLWIPGNEWGPAWVTWRRAEGYYGWAPMGPGITLSISFGDSYDSRRDHWRFVRDRDIDRSDVDHYYISSNDRQRVVINSSVIINSYTDNRRHSTYASGPTREDFQKITGRQSQPVAIREFNKPDQNQNGQLGMYRPEITSTGLNSKPKTITNLKDVKRPSERRESQTIKQENSNQPQNMRRESQTETKQQTNNPPQNIRRESQTESKQQISNPPQNIKKESQSDARTQTIIPPQNMKRESPTETRKQSDNPPQNINRESQTQTKQQSTNPPQNIKRESNTRQQNTNSPQKIKIEEQKKNTNSSENSKSQSGSDNRNKQRRKSTNNNDNKK